MTSVLAEKIDEARPPGVTYDESFEELADGVQIRFNTQGWHYVAANETALVTAANQLRDTAIADGWVLLEDYVDPAASGIHTATLQKTAMRLTLDYWTAQSFVIDPDDVDELRLSGEILYNPDLEPGGEG